MKRNKGNPQPKVVKKTQTRAPDQTSALCFADEKVQYMIMQSMKPRDAH